MSSVLTKELRNKILYWLGQFYVECKMECYLDAALDIIVFNPDGRADQAQEWLWAGIDFTQVEEEDFAYEAAEIIMEKAKALCASKHLNNWNAVMNYFHIYHN